MDLSIIMTYRADNGIRDMHLKYILERYRLTLPNAEIIISEDNSEEKGWKTFCKSKFVNEGVEKSTKNNLLITDIDVIYDTKTILKALNIVDNYSLIQMFSVLHYLDLSQTNKILTSEISSDLPKDIVLSGKKLNRKHTYRSGCHMLTKSNFYDANGYDERFIGRGNEDGSFTRAVVTISDKDFIILPDLAYHLHHPRDKENERDDEVRKKVAPIIQQYENISKSKNKDDMISLTAKNSNMRGDK